MRSQYERVSAGKVDFQSHGAVYSVTDTNYTQESEIISRQPGARMVARFLKRNGVDAIEVFKLK
jgi:hypothetical protein